MFNLCKTVACCAGPLVGQPVVLRTVAHAPTSHSDTAPMLEVSPSLVCTSTTSSWCVRAARTGVIQRTPRGLHPWLLGSVGSGWSRVARSLHNLQHPLVEGAVLGAVVLAPVGDIPLGDQFLVSVRQLITSSPTCQLEDHRAEELLYAVCSDHVLQVFLKQHLRHKGG